eukprot:891692-Amphidinium_carterae.1
MSPRVPRMRSSPRADMVPRSGSRVHPCTPLAADLQQLRHELDYTVLPAHHARRYATGASRGVLLGLYTKQGGCGITSATRKYDKLRAIVLKVARQLRVDFTSVQINVFEAGDESDPTTLQLHQDQGNLQGSLIYPLMIGEYTGGRVWSEDVEAHGHPPPACLLQSPAGTIPADVKGRWVPAVRGAWLLLDPFAYHGVEPIYSGRRYSLSVFSAAGLPRVPRQVWNQLRSVGFPVKTLQKKFESPLSLMINLVQQFGPQDAEKW